MRIGSIEEIEQSGRVYEVPDPGPAVETIAIALADGVAGQEFAEYVKRPRGELGEIEKPPGDDALDVLGRIEKAIENAVEDGDPWVTAKGSGIGMQFRQEHLADLWQELREARADEQLPAGRRPRLTIVSTHAGPLAEVIPLRAAHEPQHDLELAAA